MAVIPEYKSNINHPTSLNAPRQSISAPVEAFGKPQLIDAAAKTVDTITTAMLNHQLKLKAMKNDSWVSESMAHLSTNYSEYAYGKNGAPGVLSSQGKAAIGITERAKQDVQKIIDDRLKSAPDPETARVFKDRANSWHADMALDFARHEAGETRAYNIQSSADSASAQMSALGNKWKTISPEEALVLFDKHVKPELEKFSNISGKPSDGVVREEKSKYILGIITQNIASGYTDRAGTLYKKLEKHMDVKDRVGVADNIWKKQVDNKSDTLSDSYAEKLRAGANESTLYKSIEKIENDEVRHATKRKFKDHVSQFKAEQREYVYQEKQTAFDRIDSLAGDLISQQKYVDSLPSKTTSQKQIKNSAMGRLGTYKSKGGLKPRTDPGVYAQVIEKVISSEINDPKQVDDYADYIEKTDRDTIKKELEGSQKFEKSQLKAAYAKSAGIDGGSEAKLGNKGANFGEFLMWAGPAIKESNKGRDGEFIQTLADTWFLSGESKSSWKPGYGANKTFGDALQEGDIDNFLPDLPGKKTVQGIKDTFKKNPTLEKTYLDQYGGDEDLAVRGYYKAFLRRKIRGGQ